MTLTDAAWWEGSPDKTPPRTSPETKRTSFYLPLSDGTRLAVDLCLPANLKPGDKIPTIVSLTPYVRGMTFRNSLFHKLAVRAGLEGDDWTAWFAQFGYASLLVELRGGGASFGTKKSIFDGDTASDGAEVLDWIVAQPWSNGRVGATGISAVGLTSMYLATAKHPALRAIAPRFTVFDMYRSLHPGGLLEQRFLQDIGKVLRAMDSDRLYLSADNIVMQWLTRLLIVGIRPVDDDADRSLIKQAVAEHAGNEMFDLDISGVRFRDDPFTQSSVPATLDTQSPSTMLERINAAGIPVYAFGGWLDAAFSREMIDLFRNVTAPGSRLILGPWQHGGRFYSSPAAPNRPADFDQPAELIRFFDLHLKDVDRGIADEPAIHYFTMGEERWKTATSWPPPSTMVRYHLGSGATLSTDPGSDGQDVYTVDMTATCGVWSRFGKHLAGGKGAARYPDRATEDQKLLCYTSAPLASEIEVTGHPVVHVTLSTDKTDGGVYVYVEDVDPSGEVRHVTEAPLRVTHRDVSTTAAPYDNSGIWRSGVRADTRPAVPGEVMTLEFDLIPVSYLFKAGHSIRVAIAGVDVDNFVVVPEDGAPTLTVRTGAASWIDLPVVQRA